MVPTHGTGSSIRIRGRKGPNISSVLSSPSPSLSPVHTPPNGSLFAYCSTLRLRVIDFVPLSLPSSALHHVSSLPTALTCYPDERNFDGK